MQDLVHQILATARGMWKFRWPGLIVAWAVALIGVVVVWRIPDQYEASARIYVDTDSILKPLMSGLAVQPNVEQQIGMLSRTLISRPNLEKLVRMADLDLKNQSKADQETLIEKLQKGIELRTAGGVNLYSMSYRDAEPERARAVTLDEDGHQFVQQLRIADIPNQQFGTRGKVFPPAGGQVVQHAYMTARSKQTIGQV